MADEVEVPAIVQRKSFHLHAKLLCDVASASFATVDFPENSSMVGRIVKLLSDIGFGGV